MLCFKIHMDVTLNDIVQFVITVFVSYQISCNSELKADREEWFVRLLCRSALGLCCSNFGVNCVWNRAVSACIAERHFIPLRHVPLQLTAVRHELLFNTSPTELTAFCVYSLQKFSPSAVPFRQSAYMWMNSGVSAVRCTDVPSRNTMQMITNIAV